MAHERFRKFNTAETYPEQKLDNDLCQLVKARGTMVFVRGQVGQDLETSENVGGDDPAAQAEQAMKNVKMLLEEAGSSLIISAASRSTSCAGRTGIQFTEPSVSGRRACTPSPPASLLRASPGRNGSWRSKPPL